jgi:hypothetical protein
VNPEGDPTEFFTFAGLGVSSVEELHTAKEYTRGKILQGFSAFHDKKKILRISCFALDKEASRTFCVMM